MQKFLNIAVIGTVITAAILTVGVVASASAMTLMPGNQTGGKIMSGNATGGMMKGNETGMMKGNMTTPPLMPKK
jgi:hypothetical protein